MAAVSGVCEAPHMQVAQAIATGAGSLLGLHAESAPPQLPGVRHMTSLAQARDMPYVTFYATVAALPHAEQSTLWRRQMVLGPTPEFGLLSSDPPVAPPALQPLSLSLNPI